MAETGASAGTGYWIVNEDGCLPVIDNIESVIYHPSLNVVLVTSKTGVVQVVDVTSGAIFHSSDLSADAVEGVRCNYLPSQDRVVFISDKAVGARRDLNGVLLLDSALQTTVSKPDGVVCVELTLPDAVHLCRYIKAADLPGVDYVTDVLKELDRQIEVMQRSNKRSHKSTKWSTVCLKMSHSNLKSAFGGLLAELKRLQQKVPALPIVAAVNDRLGYLVSNGGCLIDMVASGGIVDRSLMYSESARRDTFAKWPHGNYKWALPEPMAQAGFYYQPSSSGDDRAMCFTCNVCLVCWEPTDEPWSEHERHSPQCPFVKGELTQNVPLSVTYATEPAQLHGECQDRIECLSTTTSRQFMATSTLHGDIVVWNVDTQLKKHLSLKVDLSDSIVVANLGFSVPFQSDIKPAELLPGASSCDYAVPHSSGKAEIAEQQLQSSSDEVYVNALSVLADPSPTPGSIGWPYLFSAKPCLTVASLIFADMKAAVTDSCPSEDLMDAKPIIDCSLLDSDVHVLNQLNIALSGTDKRQQTEIIKDKGPLQASRRLGVACLIVHSIPPDKTVATFSAITEAKQKKAAPTLASKLGVTAVTSGGGSSNIGGTADDYTVKDIDISDDDYDVQIIGMTPPSATGNYEVANVEIVNGKTIPGKESAVLSDALPEAGGKVIQCIRLPVDGQYVTCMLPTSDGQRLFVATASVSADERMRNSWLKHYGTVSSEIDGYVFLYQVRTDGEHTVLDTTPFLARRIEAVDDVVKRASLLPADFGQSDDSEVVTVDVLCHGMIAATTYVGNVHIYSLADLSVVAVISGDKFTDAVYCSGVDRLCAVTTNNKLKFFSVCRPDSTMFQPLERELADEVDGWLTFGRVSSSDQVAGSEASSPTSSNVKNRPDVTPLLVERPLTTEVLTMLYDLTKFENLLPRFIAMVPPCWTEIQQEQQQRKHPQHLHQQHGDASQHTRTWRLQPDSSSWDEHLFELILPKPCSIGHIDIKFCFNTMCTSPPNVQVTLLKQQVSGIKLSTANTYFKDAMYEDSANEDVDLDPTKASGVEQVTRLAAASAQDAEIVCGPVDLAKFVDLSGSQGIIPLTSVRLLKAKSKSFLLHLKAKLTTQDKTSDKVYSQNLEPTVEKSKLSALSGIKLPNVPASSAEQMSASKPSRVENLRGCDWLQEVSVTVRKFRRTRLPSERVQRFAMLECQSFHKRLLIVACGHDDGLTGSCTSKEHRQQLALDILCWIVAIQMNDQTVSSHVESENASLLVIIQFNLSSLIQCCLLNGDRSIAHKCARLIALCLEYVKCMTLDSEVALAFNYSLLQSLLDALPLTLVANSAGALHWFFTLLNHVKCLDASAAAERCTELLGAVAQQYQTVGGTNNYHALLRARYGLYGCPLDTELFDVDPPPLHTVPATSSVSTGSSYASVVASNMGQVSIQPNMAPGHISMMPVPGMPVPGSLSAATSANEDGVFKDLMNLCWADNKQSPDSQQMGRYLNGLLEVEPLHFTCHATSDGTRMERVDSASQLTVLQTGVSGLSGTINFSENLSSGFGALASLSTAMASAEQQLHQLQQKQLQLIKLQQQKQKLVQKLAETSKSGASHSLGHYSPYASELFPPTPKNTPFFMTPPVTPPNESYHVFVGGAPTTDMPTLADKPPVGPSKLNVAGGVASKKDKITAGTSGQTQAKPVLLWPHSHNLFQTPPPQALVIERMHSGARRFVVLDFGKPILLTDVVIPMCGDLASLSIDIWVDSEETDGHRLVVSTDIGISSLIMNDIMPPPICRYLKITTIRRYGGNTTRSRIPIGSFYGHTFILPWERGVGVPSTLLTAPGSMDGEECTSLPDQSVILSQLNVYMALLEEVQCRYSLASKNLMTLLSAVDLGGGGPAHYSQFFLKRGKRTEEDSRISQTYYECCQLQVQLNLAKRAISRLQKVLGIHQGFAGQTADSIGARMDGSLTTSLLRQSSVDKLRVIAEFLLDTLLGMTNSGATIPQIPSALYKSFTPSFAASLFRSLCVHGTRKTQTHAGVLLVRVCSPQPWWGEFLGNMLEEFFSSDQAVTVFPQDRVFILLAALGQRSLTSITASSILESILALLARLLSPITVNERSEQQHLDLGRLDLSLVGWVLLFLSKSLDSIRLTGTEDLERGNKDRDGYSGRWNFVQGESGLQGNKMSSRLANSSKLYRRKLQKRLMHHKQQLLEFQQAKKHFLSSQLEKAASGVVLDKDMEHIIKTQELLFKRQLKQYSSKHLKDIITLRCTGGEAIRRLNKSDSSANGQSGTRPTGSDMSWDDVDSSLVVSREQCLPVVRGLITLLLSMDFTCHVDLFIIACKVLARLMNSTRPTVLLSEALSLSELERLLLLTSNMEYNHGNVAWGGSWAGHSITCLLQDILEGERMSMPAGASDYAANDNDMSAVAAAVSVITDLDDSLHNSCTLPMIDDEPMANDTNAPDMLPGKSLLSNANKFEMNDMSMLVDAFMDDDLSDSDPPCSGSAAASGSNAGAAAAAAAAGAIDALIGLNDSDVMPGADVAETKPNWMTPTSKNVTVVSVSNSNTIHWGPTISSMLDADDAKEAYKAWKGKLNNLACTNGKPPPNLASNGISMALDSRLENGVELCAELRLKVMMSVEATNVQAAINAPLPPPPFGIGATIRGMTPHSQTESADEQDVNDVSGIRVEFTRTGMPTLEMLSVCFSNLFARLPSGSVNLEALLQMWLTLNDDTSTLGADANGGVMAFDTSRVPSISLDMSAVSGLLATLASMPSVSLRVWVLAFETLSLVANLRCSSYAAASSSSCGVSERWVATAMLADSNLDAVLGKFLSDAPAAASGHSMHVGPTVVNAFHNFLVRLQLRCTDEADSLLKHMLLRLLCTLSAETGAFFLCTGPLDVQCRLLEDIIEFGIATSSSIDVPIALSFINSVAVLVHRHIHAQEQVTCRSTLEPTVSARSCFGGLFAGMLRGSDGARRSALSSDTDRDQLMCNLLRLTNILVRLPQSSIAPRRQPPAAGASSRNRSTTASHPMSEIDPVSHKDVLEAEGGASIGIDSPQTEYGCTNHSLGTSRVLMTSTPNVPAEDDVLVGAAVTDEQKTETTGSAAATGVASSTTAPVMSMRWRPKVCSHDPTGSHTPSLADIIVCNQPIMIHLIEALSGCNSSTIAMILASSGLPGCASFVHDSFGGPSGSDSVSMLSVGDGIFQLLSILNSTVSDLHLMVKPLYQYMAGELRTANSAKRISRLSEPLLWLFLRVLDCSTAIQVFLDLGGINIVCENLVSTNRHIINTSPSLVSSIMQYFGSARNSSSSARRTGAYADMPTDSSLQNFAPLGSITSSSPSAGPADVLIQGSPPHRRARTAAWSYHFYPDEAWVDLTITLPCAVLLREITVQPHLSSLATCPSAVAIEGSRDGGGAGMVPLCTPVSTSGLTSIKIQLLRDEIVSSVMIRLHKPRDSQTIGLSQIMLMGHMAFSDMSGSAASRITNVLTPMEDYVSRTSIGWLRLLHHCLNHCDELRENITAAIAPTPDLLLTCTTLLMSTSAMLYASNIESVLLTLGLYSVDMGLALIDHILRHTAFTADEGRMAFPHGKIHGKATESTVDILYQLGTHNDAGLLPRIKALLAWLGDSARVALQKSRSAYPDIGADRYHSTSSVPRTVGIGLPTPAVVHVHVVAAILWKTHEFIDRYNVKGIITKELLSSVYEWSQVLPVDAPLKQAVDSVLCSICHIKPEYFLQVLQWIGVIEDIGPVDFTSDAGQSATDDIKGSHQNQPLTDDIKADGAATGTRQTMSLGSFNVNALNESQMSMLATCCQSPSAMRRLIDTGVVSALCSGLCLASQRKLYSVFEVEPVVTGSDNQVSTDSARVWADYNGAGPSGSRRHSANSGRSSPLSFSGTVLTADLITPTLRFLAELARDTIVKSWLGQPENCMFWDVLLRSLCTSGSSCMLMTPGSQTGASSKQQTAVETATIEFFNSVISCHAKNQLTFSRVLCDIIQSQKNALPGCNSVLSGFLRRLFLQVLLEDERVLVCISSQQPIFKGPSAANAAGRLQHPRIGAGHCFRCLPVSVNSTFKEILTRVSESPSSLAADDQQKASDDVRKDVSELGIEVIDQISAAAGLKAKEKRDKEKASASGLRPPSRRGTRNGDRSAQHTHSCLVSLYDPLVKDRQMASDLMLSQFLRQLYDQGLVVPGETCISLCLRQALGDKPAERQNKDANDATSSLTESPPLTSALQVFCSVGGLALLAEHLPLLYPEFSRQSTPVDLGRDSATGGIGVTANVPGFGHDWVTVESAEEIYEEIYEPPVPPSPPSQHKPSTAPQTLSVPPHSLVAFGLFLRLPGYAEVLLKEKRKAQCLLRLILGVTDDGEGGHILMSPFASELPTLPFLVLKSLFDLSPLTTDDGVVLRRMALEIGAVHLILACLSVLGHHAPRQTIPGFHQDIIVAATQATASTASATASVSQQRNSTEEKTQSYWAKGTGFGTGSTTSSWDAEQALLRQKTEEEHVTCLLQVLASYIHPGRYVPKDLGVQEGATAEVDEKETCDQSLLPSLLPELFGQSCLIPALSSYLRNDSVLDMACHVPLYRALLELLRAMALCAPLMPLLLPLDKDDDSTASVSSLIDKMKQCVDTYASRLKGGKVNTKSSTRQRQLSGDEESEGLALLIPDIQETAHIVNVAVSKVLDKLGDENTYDGGTVSRNRCESPSITGRLNHSEEERYIAIMKELQFDTFKMVSDDSAGVRFHVPHHYETNVKAAGDVNNAARARRLAQEAVTLSTSLPLSAGSSVFVRCDEERLDVMKVLMTGPSDTPYANGCFEFDVYFPVDYPNSPPLINLETTGNHTVRFNPNLYNDGKVCLSVLNTWHGRPEEKWNPQTSSFLQVLVSIQSLILVSEPYFNEPGYERSRGTPSGTASSREYDANIRQATSKWAMLEMLRSPSPCFKEVVEWHFWLKKNEIMSQLEEWIADLELYCNDKRVGRSISHSSVSLKRHYSQLKDELSKLQSPAPADDAAEVPVDDVSQPSESHATDADISTSAVGSPVDSISVTVSIVGGTDDEYVAGSVADKTNDGNSHLPAIV